MNVTQDCHMGAPTITASFTLEQSGGAA